MKTLLSLLFRCHFFFWIFVCFSFTVTKSQELFSEELSSPNVIKGAEELDFLERFHSSFSKEVVQTAYWLDSFFGGTRIDEETKQSRLRLNLSLQLVKNQKSILRSDVGLKLVLPHLKNRFQFLFGGEAEESLDPEKPVSQTLRDLEKIEDYSSALRYIPLASQGWNTSLDGGVKLRSSLNFFARMRIRKTIEHEHWIFRMTERLTLFEQTGLESVSSVDFDRKIQDNLFFRITPAVTWTEELSNWELNPSVSLFYQWDERHAIAFVFGVNMSTKPKTQVEEYGFKIKYRQKIKGDWLFFEMVPELAYSRENDFNVVPKIQFKIEAIFGNVK